MSAVRTATSWSACRAGRRSRSSRTASISRRSSPTSRARGCPSWSDRIFVGNALTWDPRRTFTYARTALDYVPPARKRAFLERLLGYSERVVIGVFNEHESERTTEDEIDAWGFPIGGRSIRANPWKPGMEYRVLWIDA